MTVTGTLLETSNTMNIDQHELPLIHQTPHIFAVPVAFKSNQQQKVEELQINPVATPNGRIRSDTSGFEKCQWWLKGVEDEWYPFDECMLDLQQYKNMRERIYGAWINITSSSKKWNYGDAVVFNENGSKRGPTEKNWKIPLWMRAQPYYLTCYTNPFLNGVGIQCSDSWFNKAKYFAQQCTKASSTPKAKYFLVVKPVESFSPKVVYKKRSTSTTSFNDIAF